MARKRLGLGVAPYCLPAGPAMTDKVTHREMQDELNRLRSAVALLANAVGAHVISQQTGAVLMGLLKRPEER